MTTLSSRFSGALLGGSRPLPRGRTLWLLIAAVAALQTVVLVSMIWGRATLLHHGREITLDVVPVDPRSLFQGDYARLGYDIGRVELPKSLERPRPSGSVVYVTLRRDPAGKWKAAATSETMPAAATLAPDDVVLKGRLESRTWGGLNAVRYGIERFYVPEGTGLKLEEDARAKRVAVRVAVDKEGNAAIKQLLIDGQVAVTVSPF